MIAERYRSYNPILTDEEYIADGFKPDEVAKVRRSDILFNSYDILTDEERAEYHRLIEELGL